MTSSGFALKFIYNKIIVSYDKHMILRYFKTSKWNMEVQRLGLLQKLSVNLITGTHAVNELKTALVHVKIRS